MNPSIRGAKSRKFYSSGLILKSNHKMNCYSTY